MKRQLIAIICCAACATLAAQVPYSYAPANPADSELSALGGNKNEFVQGLVLFDPATDPALQRMKGEKIIGVRCYLRADYKQARQSRSGILASIGTPANNVRTKYADFTEGWNDVLFDEPIVIGDEKIYLGVQAYETIGTPYPLVAYAPATVPQSCFVNLAKKAWEEYTDRGTLLIAALLDDTAAPFLTNTAYAQNTTHPQTVAPDADFEGGLYVHNFSDTPITSVKVTMKGEGTVTPTVRDVALPAPIAAYGSTVLTTLLHSGLSEGTNVDWTATVTEINGAEAQAGRPGTTKLYVTYDNFQRVPLIEEFTSQLCVNCPQMAYFLEKALEEFEGPYIYLSHHSGFREDVFTTATDRELVYIFGGYENEYNPAIMYNRAVLEGESSVIQGVRGMAPTPYTEALLKAAAMPAKAEVSLKREGGEVRVSGRVARDLVDSQVYLSVCLVEDGMTATQYRQTGMDDPDAPADLAAVFRHNGVALHSYNTAPLGDLLEIDTEKGTFNVSYPEVEKKGFGGTGRRLVAIVHKVNKADLRDNEVLNATQLDLNATGINSVHTAPATDAATYDLLGRRVNHPTKGVYLRNGQKILR